MQLGSVQVELGANDNFDLLIERAGTSKAELVDVPINADNRLLRHDFLIKEFYATSDAYGEIILVLDCTTRWVVILIKVESSITTKRGEQITVLREMFDSPNSGVMSQFGEASVALFRMVGFQVENVHFRFKCCNS